MQTTIAPQRTIIYKHTCIHTRTEYEPSSSQFAQSWVRETHTKCDDCTAKWDAKLARAEAGRSVYIRFGDAPECGYSWNDRDGSPEDGISVYAAWILNDNTIVLDMRDADLCSYVFGGFEDRPAYLATGTVIGTGSDGEPLLDDIDLDPVAPTAVEYII